MKDTFGARLKRRLGATRRRVKQFLFVHPYQALMLGLLMLLVGGQIVVAVGEKQDNHREQSRLVALPKTELSDLGKAIEAEQVAKVIRHTVSTGTLMRPELKNFIEVVDKQGKSSVLEENNASSQEIWKGLIERAFTYPVVLERGYQADREDRVASVLRTLAMLVGFVMVILFAQLMIGEVLSGKDFKVQKRDLDIKLKDVIGNEEVKASLLEVIDQLHHASEYAQQKIVAPRGILFTGDPGVGKTMLAKALANEIGADFFFATGADFAEMYVGVGPKRVRSLFKRARMSRLALVFLDEIDAIGSRDELGNDSERRSTINAFLSEMDGMETNGRLLVVGATNHLDRLDPALRRPGRFDRIVHIPLPSAPDREAILAKYLTDIPLDGSVDLKAMALRTQGYSGAQLSGVVAEAKKLALREKGGRGQAFVVSQEHLQHAQEIALLGEAGRMAVGEELRRVTVHELGHALTGHLRCPKAYVEKVTVRGRGQALGYALSRPLEESLLVNREEYHGQLVMSLGGRAAEQVLLGNVSNGAVDDLRKATAMARTMVLNLGMGRQSGLMVQVRPDETLRREQIQDINEILTDAYEEALAIVNAHRPWFAQKTEELMEHGMLPHDVLFAGINTPPQALQ